MCGRGPKFSSRNAQLYNLRWKMLALRCEIMTYLLILSARAFGLVAWFSLRVREVPSSILGMPHITNIGESCFIFVSQTLIGYIRAVEFNSHTIPLNLHQQELFEFGLSKHDLFTNVNVIIALTRAFSLPAQFSIIVWEVQNSILAMHNLTSLHDSSWSYVCQQWTVLRISRLY